MTARIVRRDLPQPTVAVAVITAGGVEAAVLDGTDGVHVLGTVEDSLPPDDHAQQDTERAARRQAKGDRRVARSALHRARGDATTAAARLRIQADDDRERAARDRAAGRPFDAIRQRGERRERAALLLDRGEVTDANPQGDAR